MKFKVNHWNGISAFIGLRGRINVARNEAWIFDLKRMSRIMAGVDMVLVFTKLGIFWLDENMKVVDKRLAFPFCFYLPRKKARYVVEVNHCHIDKYKVGQKFNI